MEKNFSKHTVPKLHRLFSGTVWNLSSQLVAGLLRFTSTAIAAHYLSPSDFGVFGLAYVVIGLLVVFKAYGMGAFLIHKNDCDEVYYNTAFWINIISGVGLFLLAFFMSPLIALYYKSKALEGVISIIALDFIIGELSSINNIRLQKALKFHLLGIVEIIRSLSQSAIVVGLAIYGYGVWGLVYAVIAANLIACCLLFYIERWRPRLVFSWDKFKEIFKFGKNLLGESFCNYISQNLDYLIIGRILGTSPLGIYKLAYGLPHLIYENFPQKVTPVLYPFLCQIRSNVNEYKKTFIQSVSLVLILAFPMLSFLGFNASDIISLLYGERWLPMTRLVQIFIILAMARCVGTFVGSILNSLGRPDLGFKINVIKLPVFAVSIYFSAVYLGLDGVCWVMTIIETISVTTVYIFLSRKFIEGPEFKNMAFITCRAALLAVAPILIMYILANISVETSTDIVKWERLAMSALIWIGSWFILYLVFWRRDLVTLCNFGISFLTRQYSD